MLWKFSENKTLQHMKEHLCISWWIRSVSLNETSFTRSSDSDPQPHPGLRGVLHSSHHFILQLITSLDAVLYWRLLSFQMSVICGELLMSPVTPPHCSFFTVCSTFPLTSVTVLHGARRGLIRYQYEDDKLRRYPFMFSLSHRHLQFQ